MCGIWGYLALTGHVGIQKLFEAFNKVKDRGPDRSDFKTINEFVKIYPGFHRLAIMDKSTYGDQPFTVELSKATDDNEDISIYGMCNGEIYNYKQLAKDNQIQSYLKGRSDCEVIPHLYVKHGFVKMLQMLRGEFAICVLEINHTKQQIKMMIGRDQQAVRPLFIGMDSNGIVFSSILKGVVGLVEHKSVRQLGRAEAFGVTIEMKDGKPVVTESGSLVYHKLFSSLDTDNKSEMSSASSTLGKVDHSVEKQLEKKSESKSEHISSESSKPIQEQIPKSIFDKIRAKLIEASLIKLESDRAVGALLSGGLDSSLLVSIIADEYFKMTGKRLPTFSIGIPGSTDKEFAEMVAKHCNTKHTHVEFTEQQFLDAIEDVIIATETHDITTVRASVGQYLIAKWIKENTDIRVLINGDGSDELTSGYMYFHNAPDAFESHKENIRLLEEIMYFDVLRVDRCIAHNGIEARVPFLDHEFVELYLSIDPRYRVPLQEGGTGRKIEKWLLRKSFDTTLINSDGKEVSFLPKEVLWRKKEAFSDGVSSQKRSWYQVIQESVKKIYTQEDLEHPDVTYHLKPTSMEALHYRKLFNKHFHPELAHVIPHYWLPKWSGNIKEPSARVLSVYQ